MSLKEQKRWCDWHVIHIEDPDDEGERSFTVLHPQHCNVSVSSRGNVTYECWVGYELEMSGWIGYFDPKNLEVSPGWYRIRGRTYEERYGLEAVEIDSEEEVESMFWVPLKDEIELEQAGDDSTTSTEVSETDHP